MLQFPDLSPALGAIPWAVVGAAATRLYMPERATRDLDVVVAGKDAPEVRRRLREAGFTFQGELSIGGSSWVSPGGLPVDVLELAEPWLRQALEEAAANRDPQGLPILPLPYLVLMKVRASRVQDLADVARMLGQADQPILDAVRQLFVQYMPDDLEDLESLIVLGKMELEPPSPEGGPGKGN